MSDPIIPSPPELSELGQLFIDNINLSIADMEYFDITMQVTLNNDPTFTKCNVLTIRYKTVEMLLYFIEDNVTAVDAKQIHASIYDRFDWQHKNRLILDHFHMDSAKHIDKILQDLMSLTMPKEV